MHDTENCRTYDCPLCRASLAHPVEEQRAPSSWNEDMQRAHEHEANARMRETYGPSVVEGFERIKHAERQRALCAIDEVVASVRSNPAYAVNVTISVPTFGGGVMLQTSSLENLLVAELHILRAQIVRSAPKPSVSGASL